VSLLSRDHYRFALRPDRVLFTHRRRFLRERVERKSTWATDRGDDGVTNWNAALEALRRHLPAAAGRPPTASFILSSHFCHFALLPRNDALAGRAELLAYARHRMKAVLDDTAGEWVLTLSDAGGRNGHVASAVDGALVESIRTLCREKNLGLASIRPHFAVAFNTCRKALEDRSAWFVVHEDGLVTVSHFSHGNWQSLARRRVGPRWQAELVQVLDREQLLMEGEAAECNHVLLLAPEYPRAGTSQEGRYQFEILRPDTSKMYGDGNHAMAA